MALTAKKGASYPPIEAGTHHAVCFGVIDLGTQESEWQGVEKEVHQILIMWELPSLTYEMVKDGQTIILTKTISRTYTLSLGEKAKLRADLISWRGMPFTEEELEEFDVFTVLGANCLLQIIHTKKGDKVYGNISSIAKLMKGMTPLKPTRELVRYSMEEDGCLVPANVPEWVAIKIKLSAEYKAEMQPSMDEQQPPEDESQTADSLPASDDIPF